MESLSRFLLFTVGSESPNLDDLFTILHFYLYCTIKYFHDRSIVSCVRQVDLIRRIQELIKLKTHFRPAYLATMKLRDKLLLQPLLSPVYAPKRREVDTFSSKDALTGRPSQSAYPWSFKFSLKFLYILHALIQFTSMQSQL